MEFKQFMNALAARAGVAEGFAPDEDGVIHLTTGSVELAFMEIPERDELLLWSRIGELPSTRAEAALRALMQANFIAHGTTAGTLSLDDDGFVCYHRFLSLPQTEIEAAMDFLEDFLVFRDGWKQLLDESAAATNESTTGGNDEAAGPAPIEDGSRFLRV